MTSRAAVFLDRDGVIIENRSDHIRSWEHVRFLPGSLDALRTLAATDLAVVLVTNQSAIGRGLLTPEEASHINDRLTERIVESGGRLDAVYMCPHDPAAGCDCRKPAPGMLLRAANEMALSLADSFLIGDARTDVEAARAAGVRPILVLSGRGKAEATGMQPGTGCLILNDLREATNYVLSGTEEA